MRSRRPPAAPPTGFVAFARDVLGVRLTRAQRVLALVAFDGVDPCDLLTAADRDIARQLFGDVDRVPRLVRAVLALFAGRASGKTRLGALRLVHLAFTAPLDSLAPGEHAFGIIVAPDLKLARQALRFVIGALEASPLARHLVAETADNVTIRRADGRTVVIECLPCSRGGSAVRGRTLIGALLDESSFFLDEDYVANDAALFAAIAPRVVGGGQVLIFSTPWTENGLLFELTAQNHGRPTTCLAAHAATALMRDNAPDVVAMIERERLRDPQNARREFDALFVDGQSTLLRSSDVVACTDPVAERKPRRECAYGCTVDVGLRNDATAILIFHVERVSRAGAPPVRMLVIDAVRVLKPEPGARTTLDEVEDAVATLCRRYRVAKVHADLHYADALAPRLRARGLVFVELSMSSGAQEKRATSMVARFTARTVRLVSDATLAKELKGLKLTRHAGGRVSVGAPESKRKHDDVADTMLLACEVEATLPAAGGDIEHIVRVGYGEGGIRVSSRWFARRKLPGGGESRMPCEPPPESPEFEAWANGMLDSGHTTESIVAWQAQRALEEENV